jgi:hypothetical protein
MLEQPLERDSRAGGRRVRSLPAFARRQQGWDTAGFWGDGYTTDG